MKLVNLFWILLSFHQITVSQIPQVPIEDIIAISKKSAVPIWARDSSWPTDSVNFGTAVIVGDANNIYALTCEHVIALKDSLGKTTKYLPQLFVGLNRQDDSTIVVPVRLDSADEVNDFALLRLPDDILKLPLTIKLIPLSQWTPKGSLREGNNIVFIGYPMALGVGGKNEPLSRTAIISQLSEGNPYFIIDGFVQHGHSGSPVFISKVEQDKWVRYLVGIARGFPKEFTPVLQKVGLTEEGGRLVILNPGFSVITSVDVILPVIRSLMK